MTRSRWRVFLTVFLVVFLGGFGVSGAAALWSVTANATASVTTGTWIDYTRPGFSMPLTDFSVRDAEFAGIGQRRIQMSWVNPATSNPATPSVTYKVEAITSGDLRITGKSLPQNVSQPTVAFETTTPLLGWGPQHVDVKVTPVVGGVEGIAVVKRVWLDSLGRTWLTEPAG